MLHVRGKKGKRNKTDESLVKVFRFVSSQELKEQRRKYCAQQTERASE